MKTKQLVFTGAAVVAASKFYFQSGWKPALILGAVAALAAAVADDVIPSEG